jgi:hypothetical protein
VTAALTFVFLLGSSGGSDTATISSRTYGDMLTVLVEKIDHLETRTTYEVHWHNFARNFTVTLLASFLAVLLGVKLRRLLRRRVIDRWSSRVSRPILVAVGILAGLGLSLLLDSALTILRRSFYSIAYELVAYKLTDVLTYFLWLPVFFIFLAFIVAGIGERNTFWIPTVIGALMLFSLLFFMYSKGELSPIQLLQPLALISVGAALFMLRKRLGR